MVGYEIEVIARRVYFIISRACFVSVRIMEITVIDLNGDHLERIIGSAGSDGIKTEIETLVECSQLVRVCFLAPGIVGIEYPVDEFSRELRNCL